MLRTKLIDPMKYIKDRMGDPLPVGEMNQLLDIFKTVGATHVACSTVIGHPNFIPVSKQWSDAIEVRGMKPVWRCAHGQMEFERDNQGNVKYRPDGKPQGLYGVESYIGNNRKSLSFWFEEAKKAATLLKDIVKPGHEWAIFPERTEGLFNNEQAWLTEGVPFSYATFFIEMNNACKAILPPGVIMGKSANNGSELLNGWIPSSLVMYADEVVVDHYRDGDINLYEQEIRAMRTRYNRPVYVQEGAPNRSVRPTRQQADAYFAVNKKLADEGILSGFGSWSGWAGNPESIVDKDAQGKYYLNDSGKSLQAWWTGVVVVPTPPTIPVPPTTPPLPPVEGEHFIQVFESMVYVGVTNEGGIYEYYHGQWVKIKPPVFS